MKFSRSFPNIYIIAARVGLTARGATYLLVSALLLWAALSPIKKDLGINASDAFFTLEQSAAGRVVLLCMGGGLLIYALWRWMTAVQNDNNPDRSDHRVLTRVGMVMSGTGYAILGAVAIAVTFGANDAGGPDKTEQLARWLLSMPLGQWLLVGFGLIVAGFGVVQFWLVISHQWRENLVLTGWSKKLKPVAFFGVVGRAILFLLVAFFLIVGGLRADPNDVKGIAQTLGWLRQQEYGFFLYLGAGLAICSYGIFSLIQARCYALEHRSVM